MSVKRIQERCQVKTRSGRPLPYLFRWRENTWEVREVIEVWRFESKWWAKEGPERRTYYRCLAHSGNSSRGGNTVVELCKRSAALGEEWFLARLAD